MPTTRTIVLPPQPVAPGYAKIRRTWRKGDRVAVSMRNYPEWSAICYAAWTAGLVVVPLNAWWTGPELEYGLVDSGTRIAFVDAERLERINEHLVNCPALKRIYVSRFANAPG